MRKLFQIGLILSVVIKPIFGNCDEKRHFLRPCTDILASRLDSQSTSRTQLFVQKEDPTYKAGRYYEDTYLNPGRIGLRSLTRESMLAASDRMIATLDRMFVSYREGLIDTEQLWNMLLKADFLVGTGFLLRQFSSSNVLTGIATQNNWQDWVGISGAMHLYNPTLENLPPDQDILPGFVQVETLRVENGYLASDTKNKLVNLFYIIQWAEEFYHVAQLLRTGDPYLLQDQRSGGNFNFFSSFLPIQTQGSKDFSHLAISKYVRSGLHQIPTFPNRALFLEFDVFAKLLEVFGPELIPKWWIQFSGYHFRNKILQDRIEKLNLSDMTD